jgi:hypothetical protein
MPMVNGKKYAYTDKGKAAAKKAKLRKKQKVSNMADGLYKNINDKRKRIAAGSGEKMRKPGSKGSPTAKAFKQAKKTAKTK